MTNTDDLKSTIYELAMIGLLYGEDIHLLNNKLGAALQHLINVIEFSEGLDKESKEELNRAKKLLEEILEIQKEKSDFAILPLRENFDLLETINKSIQSISIPINITIERRFESKNPIIDGYQKQTGQFFRALFHNAIEAMRGNGKLTIFIEDSILDNAIEVTVTDTGILNKTELPKSQQIKKDWKMGLTWAHAYLQTCGGNLSFGTEPGKGTTFKVTLPKKFSMMSL